MARNAKERVVVGLLGTQLDTVEHAVTRKQWRPTVSLFQHEELQIHRFELLYQPDFSDLAESITQDIAAVSPKTTIRMTEIRFKDPWDFDDVFSALYDFTRTYSFDTESEEYFVHITTGTHVAQICLFLLTESRHLPAKLIQTSPPKKRDSKPRYNIVDLELAKYAQIMARFLAEEQEAVSFLKSGIKTRNPAFNTLIDEIERVAGKSKSPILLMGPTGAGKSRLARRIYELKKQRHRLEGEFVETNCATISGDTAMSTLFGHIIGAFTGATKARKGLLRMADKGILFLDEIGDLGLDEQAMLLRAVEEKTFFPFGSDKEEHSDFQLISGTSSNLVALTREGKFRKDLLARIKLWTFQLPALRERVEDIGPNLEYELEEYSHQTGERVLFKKDALDKFLSFAESPDARWADNFRDLNSAVIRMASAAEGGRISAKVVNEEIARLRDEWGEEPMVDPGANLESLLDAEVFERLDPFDLVQLDYVVTVARQSRTLSEAGRRIFAVSRRRRKKVNDADRLRKYLAGLGLEWDSLKGD